VSHCGSAVEHDAGEEEAMPCSAANVWAPSPTKSTVFSFSKSLATATGFDMPRGGDRTDLQAAAIHDRRIHLDLPR
jgi:hypothetical protein